MKIYNFYKNIFATSIAVALITSSCSEDQMDKLNRDRNNFPSASAEQIFSDLVTKTAFSITGGSYSTYISVYIEHEGGKHNQMFYADTRVGEPISTSTFNDPYTSSYAAVLEAKLIIDKCSEGGPDAGNDITLAASKILLAYNGAVLTDLFGDVPFSQAGIVDKDMIPVYRQPVVDKQEDIYKEIFKLLDEAIVILEKTSTANKKSLGKADFIYNGDKAAWLKAAYGLKARYTMRLLNRSANKETDLNNILNYISKSFSSASDELKFSKYNGSDQSNPLYAFTASRNGLGASESYAEKLKQRNDPRLTQIFMNFDKDSQNRIVTTDTTKLVLFPNGRGDQNQTKYSVMITDYSSSTPTIMLSYHELLFLKAEAYARLGAGQKANAEAALKEAIKAGFANLENSINATIRAELIKKFTPNLSDTVSSKYYDTSVKNLFDSNPVKEIMVQKYLAFAGANGESIEAYNDYRRLQGANENYIELKNPLNTTKFPYRLPYGANDANNNKNVNSLITDSYYVYKEKVWWAGGTR